jgi:hypothetical protein
MKEAERVGKYMIRPLLSLERLSFSEKEGQAFRELLMAAEAPAKYFS